MSCPTDYFRTPYNVQYQRLYGALAQQADTNLENVVTSGWSYNKMMQNKDNVVEKFCPCKGVCRCGFQSGCGCGFQSDYITRPIAEYYDPRKDNLSFLKQGENAPKGGCSTDFLRTPYNVAYQKLYGGLAERADTNLFTFAEPYMTVSSNGRFSPKNTTVFYDR